MAGRSTVNLFNDIYQDTNKKVLSYITAKCSRTSDIRDIFQETYMEVYTALTKHSSDYVKNSEAFVMKIAKQKIFRYYSFIDRVKSVIPLFTTNEDGEEVNICDFESDSILIENEIDERLIISQINKFLLQKPLEIQKIFYLHYYMGKTLQEISKLLSISESNVKNKLYRTLKELRKQYDKDSDLNE